MAGDEVAAERPSEWAAFPFGEGQDVAALLGVGKWEPSIECSTGGDSLPDPGHMRPYTDIEGYRRHKTVIGPDEEVVCTEKVHGANGRWCVVDGQLWCGSRTNIKADTPTSIWWHAARRWDLARRLDGLPYAIYGEVYGQVQDLKYGEGRINIALFDVLDRRSHRYLDYDDFRAVAASLDLPIVPELYRGRWGDCPAGLAEGVTVLGQGAHVREGFVVRPVRERFDERVGRVILKMVGEGYHTRKSDR